MQTTHRYVLTLASAALLCGTAAAQERATPPSSAQVRPLKAGDVQASNLIGAAVKSTSGDAIGEVTDLIVSSAANVSLAVVSVGGVLGVGEKKIAIPYKEFSVAPDGNTLYLAMTEEQLKAHPAFEGDRDTPAASNRTTAPAPGATAATAARQDAPAPRATGAPQRAAAVPAATSAPAPRTLKAAEQPASALIGAAVVDSRDSKVGKIHDLIVTAGQQAPQAILSLGGVAGVGSHMVAVPLDKLTIKRAADEDRRHEPDSVQTLLTVSQLEALPEFRYE
jgi:sporulation protein YlmC with PRC-barrel domain